MSIKLLPASVNPVDPPQAADGTASLVPLTQRAVTTRGSEIGLVPSADGFAWSPSSHRGPAKFIDATPVEDPQSDATGQRGGESVTAEYVSGWDWSHSAARTAVAHYLLYAGGPASWSGQRIDLYA